MSSRPTKSLYIPSATKSSGTRGTDSKYKISQDQSASRKSDQSQTPIISQEQQNQIVILERESLADEVERLLKEDKCWILDEIYNQDTKIQPLKIMDEGLQMVRLDYSFHSNYDFTVIGVVGFDGVGKSTILSKLAGDHVSPFNVSKDVNELGTAGIELFITPERVILLDSQPIMSPLVLERLKSKRFIPGSFSRRAHVWNEILSKRQTAFLWSVCDILLVVLDENTCSKMLDFLKNLEFRGYKKNATVIFIYNKSFGNTFSPETYQNLVKEIRLIPGLNWEEQVDCCHLKNFYPDLYSKLEDANLFLLPCFTKLSCDLSLDMSYESFNMYRNSLMGVPNDFTALFHQFRAGLMKMIPLKNTQTEKEWFKSVIENWDNIIRIKWPIST